MLLNFEALYAMQTPQKVCISWKDLWRSLKVINDRLYSYTTTLLVLHSKYLCIYLHLLVNTGTYTVLVHRNVDHTVTLIEICSVFPKHCQM